MALPELTKALEQFAEERDWHQFHSPKNFAMALMVEAGELMDPFQWCESAESRTLVQNPEVKAYLTKEAGDVLINLLQFCRWCGIDAEQAAWDKLATLKVRYDAETVRARSAQGNHVRLEEATGKAQFGTLVPNQPKPR